MKQPLSRDSFNRRRGYLGLYLQEGAPLVDALWNEGSDIHASLLRDALQDAGIEGATGIELRLDPVISGKEEGGKLVNLVIRGGPRRFYCGGLPISWPEDRPIDAQSVDQGPLLDHHRSRFHGPGTIGRAPRWLECLHLNEPYPIYVEAWIETADALDRPDLDDPALSVERGSFRKRVRSRVGVGHPSRARTNVLLTVQGSYVADRNVLYRVDLVERVELPAHPPETGGWAASVLWDDAGAALVGKVAQRAAEHASQVTLSDTGPFTQGSYVRFEGAGVKPEIYEVTGRDATTISVRRHDCSDCRGSAASLDRCHGISLEPGPEGTWKLLVADGESHGHHLDQLHRGGRLSELPRNLRDRIEHDALERLQIASVDRGLVTEHHHGEHHYERKMHAVVRLAPDGLLDALEPWNEEHAAELVFPAHPFHTCIEVGDRPEWSEGMRVRVHALPPEGDAKARSAGGGAEACQPGGETIDSYEDRTIARLVRHGPNMTLRLDQPLAFEHRQRSRVVPERLIRARRYQGHACAVKIDTVDPAFEPTEAHHEGPYELGGALALPTGLSLRLSVESKGHDSREEGESKEKEATRPVLVPGEGWSFAARAGGWVEAPVFAPVDEARRGHALLAELTLRENGFELVDLRPVPAPQAHHGWLAIIAGAADEIAQHPDYDRAEWIARLARLAGGMRAQRELIPAIRGLLPWVNAPDSAIATTPLERAFQSLRRALHGVHDEHPASSELSRVSAAMARLACVLGCGSGSDSDREEAERPPRPPERPPKRPEPEGKAPHEAPVKVPVEAAPAVDIRALPTEHLHASGEIPSKQLGEVLEEWPTLGAVPGAGEVANKRRRRLAEVVALLLEQTAALGARAAAPDADRAALQAELDALWSSHFQVAKLERPLTIDAAIAHAKGGGSKP